MIRSIALLGACALVAPGAGNAQAPSGPRSQPDAEMSVYSPRQHELYDGHFSIRVAGWGYGHATLDGEPLYQDYEIHFMVTQGMRDRETRAVMLSPSSGEAGSVNPATQQLDFYIRSPARNPANHPDREVFDHFFAMEVTWR